MKREIISGIIGGIIAFLLFYSFGMYLESKQSTASTRKIMTPLAENYSLCKDFDQTKETFGEHKWKEYQSGQNYIHEFNDGDVIEIPTIVPLELEKDIQLMRDLYAQGKKPRIIWEER